MSVAPTDSVQEAPGEARVEAPGEAPVEARLRALQCHFNWDLDLGRASLLHLRARLEDIGTEEGNVWLGHIYNLLGYVHHQLGDAQEARRLLTRAQEAFGRLRSPGPGPWLLVHYGDLAWLHHSQGEDEESRDYLEKVEALTEEHPAPSGDGPHPEVLAERAWTLMKFSRDAKLQAVDLFQKALVSDPTRVEWQTSRALALVNVHKHADANLHPEVLREVRLAMEQDPENLYLAAVELSLRADSGEQFEDEARELARRILQNPVSSYTGLKALLRLYRRPGLIDEAVELTEEALRSHPDHPFLTRCAALCYKWKLVYFSDGPRRQSVVDRAVELHHRVIALYPQSSLTKRIDLASILAKSSRDGVAKAERIFQELMINTDLDPADHQLLYHSYAKFLNFDRQDRNGSVRYHLKAAAIPLQSFWRSKSIEVLERIRGRGRSSQCRDIERFLESLRLQEEQDGAPSPRPL